MWKCGSYCIPKWGAGPRFTSWEGNELESLPWFLDFSGWSGIQGRNQVWEKGFCDEKCLQRPLECRCQPLCLMGEWGSACLSLKALRLKISGDIGEQGAISWLAAEWARVWASPGHLWGEERDQPTFLEAVLVALGPFIGAAWRGGSTPTTRSQRCTSDS